MIYFQVFMAFFLPGILGYGGGPASIPLIENEVVQHYGWLGSSEFSEVLGMGNALPGPIATKMAGYIGYQQAGVAGAAIGIFATVAPSLCLMIGLLGLLMKHKESPRVKKLTMIVRPVIAVLLGVMAYDQFLSSYQGSGTIQTIFVGASSFILMERLKVHPAFVIAGSMIYGALFLAY